MPKYRVTHPDGRKVVLTGDSPPTDQELEEIFANLGSAPTPPPKMKIPVGGTVAAGKKPGVLGGFLQASPLNPRNIYSMAKGLYAPTAEAGLQMVRDVSEGNYARAGLGALDLVQGGPATGTVTDPILQHAIGTGRALEQGDLLKAAEQSTGVIPFNAGMLQLGQENAGNPQALLGNLAGALTAPSQMRGVTRAVGAIPSVVTRAVGAIPSVPPPVLAKMRAMAETSKGALREVAMDPWSTPAAVGTTAAGLGGAIGGPVTAAVAGGTAWGATKFTQALIRSKAKAQKARVQAETALEKAEIKEAKAQQKVDTIAAQREIQRQKKMAEMDAKKATQDTKAQETASFQSGSIEARILEASQKAQTAAQADTMRARAAAENAAVKDKVRLDRELAVAMEKEAKANQRVQQANERAEAAQIRREFRQRTQLDKQAAREAAKTKPVSTNPDPNKPPTVTVPGDTGPKVASGPDPFAPARKSATAIVYAENKATGKPYTVPEIEAGIRKSHPSLTPEQVSQVARETVADAMHVETVVGGLASRGQSITQISQFIRRAYPDLPNSKLMELAVREVQAMGDAMTPAQRAELGIVRSASNKRKLDPTTLKPRS